MQEYLVVQRTTSLLVIIKGEEKHHKFNLNEINKEMVGK